MAKISDPARDFTDLCLQLRAQPGEIPGPLVVGKFFDVEPWSSDFMSIVASLCQRTEALRVMISRTDLDGDIKATAYQCLDNIRGAFTASGLQNNWKYSIQNSLSDANLTPILMMSGYVRQQNGYEVPDDDELSDIISDIETLREWLIDKNLVENDFIRAALIEGLDGFLFRIKRVGHFGWPESMEALKAVVAAYMALERGASDPGVDPPYEAMVKKVADVLKRTFGRVKTTKDVYEVGDWVLRIYGAVQAIGDASPKIAGLLTHIAK